MTKFFIKDKTSDIVNYANPFETTESALKTIYKSNGDKDIVRKSDGSIELFVGGKLLRTLEIIGLDYKIYIADIGTGELLKAYFDTPEKAIDFLYDTYDTVIWDIDYNIYEIHHKGVRFGAFEVLGGI